MEAPGPTILGAAAGAAGTGFAATGAVLVAALARRSRASQSGQSTCFAWEDLKCFPHWAHFIFTLLMPYAPPHSWCIISAVHAFSIERHGEHRQ